ncbi:MAG: HAD hydrolase-like protein [Anaerolineales bacterium]
MILYILWDAGGTLFDTYPSKVRAIQRAAADLGARASAEQILAWVKQSTHYGLEKIASEHGLELSDLEARYKHLYKRIGPEAQPPFPGVEKLCRYICEIGGANFIATHRGRESLTMLLEGHEMTHYFVTCITKEDPYPRKPDPASLDTLLADYDLPRDATLTIGDRALDIEAGHKAGLRTCFFGEQPPETEADIVVASFETLYEHIVAENRRAGVEHPAPPEQRRCGII